MIKKIIHGTLLLFFPLFRKVLPFQVYAYLAVGTINTVLNIILFAVFYQFLLPTQGWQLQEITIASYTLSLLLAFVFTVPTGFWLAKHFAFQQGTNSKQAQQLGKYFLVVLQGLGSDYLILKALIMLFSMQPTVAKIISTVVVLTANYLLQKYFTFRVKPA